MHKDEVRVTLRLPADLHAALAAVAQQEQRSPNSEIVYQLRQSIAPVKQGFICTKDAVHDGP